MQFSGPPRNISSPCSTTLVQANGGSTNTTRVVFHTLLLPSNGWAIHQPWFQQCIWVIFMYCLYKTYLNIFISLVFTSELRETFEENIYLLSLLWIAIFDVTTFSHIFKWLNFNNSFFNNAASYPCDSSAGRAGDCSCVLSEISRSLVRFRFAGWHF